MKAPGPAFTNSRGNTSDTVKLFNSSSVADLPRINGSAVTNLGVVAMRGFPSPGVVVSGLSGTGRFGNDMAQYNGAYRPDPGAKQQAGFSCPHKNEHGKGTIERRWDGQWYLNEDYSGRGYFYCESDSPTPPLTGWEVTSYGTEPPPSLSRTTRVQARPLPAPAATPALEMR